ncbi:hypothetical protein ACLK1T_19515 [Escherichia coli]
MSAISLINSGVAWFVAAAVGISLFFSKSVKWLDSWNWRRGW